MKLVFLSNLFEFRNGHGLELLNCEEQISGVPFISRTRINNGVAAFIEELDDCDPLPGHCITVALGGSVLSSFYQPSPFYTAFHIQCLYPKSEMTTMQMLYYCMVIEANRYRYSYGRQANKTLRRIQVPDLDSLPIALKTQPLPRLNAQAVRAGFIELQTQAWLWFTLDELFHIEKGKRLTKADMEDGDIRFIGSTEYNNGVTAHIANDEHVHQGNAITVAYNGSVGQSFYQDKAFVASDDVNVLRLRSGQLNPYIGLFLVTVLENEKYRFSYGRKWNKEKMQLSRIRLPATASGKPDWDFMQRYIQTLPYSGRL